MHPPMHCRALFKSWARCQSICKRAGDPSSLDQLRYFSATAATQNFPRAPLSASRDDKWLFGEIQPRVDPQEAGQQCNVMMMMHIGLQQVQMSLVADDDDDDERPILQQIHNSVAQHK